MSINKHTLIKSLLELAQTTQEANAILEEHTGYSSVEEKTAYLIGMFNFDISRYDDDSISEEIKKQDDYSALLAAIIDMKWR